MPQNDRRFDVRHGVNHLIHLAGALLLALGAVYFLHTTAHAQTTVNWNDIECGGGGWADPGIGPAGPATQSFSNV